MRLADDPVRVPRQRPARDRSDECLALRQAAHQVRHQVRQVRNHPAHAAVGHGAEREDTALLEVCTKL